jgi:tol-pal system protein YbgF
MIRRSILSRARPTLLLAIVAVVAPGPAARSQDRAIQDRLDRLERDLSMLQRQVYRGSAPSINPGSGGAVDAELRMDRLEAQMRELTGRVEDAANGVEQLRRRLEQINADIEVRFNQSPGQPRGAPPNSHAAAGITDSVSTGSIAMRGPTPSATSAPSRQPAGFMPPGTLVPPPQDPPTGTGTLTPPGLPQPGAERASAGTVGGLRSPPSSGSPAGSISEQYNYAFSFIKQADYPAAEEALKVFVRQHPDDALASNAQYWLGETFFVRHKYAEAVGAFADGYKRYPKGAKAADDLLKLGMSLSRANQKQNACVALAQLDRDFPNPGSAIRDQAAKEKKQLGC